MRSAAIALLGTWLVISTAAPAVHAQASCPASFLQVYNGHQYYSNAPQRAIGASDYVYSSASAQYDLNARTFGAGASSTPGHGASAKVGVMAQCTVVGPAPGTPLTFTANLHVTGSGGFSFYGDGAGTALIRENGTSNEQSATASQGPLTTDIDISLQKNAGDAFVLYLEGSANSLDSGGGSIAGALSFVGLPPGASVSICLGSDAGGLVRTRPATWGAIKTLYR